jgi:hypothetical protein
VPPGCVDDCATLCNWCTRFPCCDFAAPPYPGAGEFPSALGGIAPLRTINLAGNRLGGNLNNFAARIAPAANSLLALNLSGNQITGGLSPLLQVSEVVSAGGRQGEL